MLSFTPTEEQQMLVDAVSKYVAHDVQKVAHDADEDNALPVNVVRKGWELGILPAAMPEAFGGLGEYSAVTNVLAAEELAYGDLAVALAVMAPGLVGLPVLLSGTDEQKQITLPSLADETPPPLTAALLEPGITFDATALKTTATCNDDHYVLNGKKCYVPLAADARLLLVYARDSETGKIDGYLVEGGAEGLKVGKREK